MATVSQYLETAASYIGVSGTDNIFNTWYWGHPCYDPDTYPWCAAYQSYVGVHDLSMPFTPSASAAGVAWQGVEIADEDVQPGDWVLFNWDGDQDFSWADHIGVVEWSDINGSGYFGTIEGNTGWGEGTVARCTRYNWGDYGTKFFRPPYDHQPAPTPTPTPTPGQSVWQGAVIGLIDLTGAEDDYAGVVGKPILDIAAGNVGKYQASDIYSGWWPTVDDYDLDDPENGYAGNDAPIDKFRIFDPTVYYQLHELNGVWHAIMKGLVDTGGSGDDFAGEDGVQHDLLRIWRADGEAQPVYQVKS